MPLTGLAFVVPCGPPVDPCVFEDIEPALIISPCLLFPFTYKNYQSVNPADSWNVKSSTCDFTSVACEANENEPRPAVPSCHGRRL